MIAFESRASIALYKFLLGKQNLKKFILPLNVCPVVPSIFLKLGIDFDFIDIHPNTLCIREDALLDYVKSGFYGGVCFVHTYGVEMQTQELFLQIKNINSDFLVIDDRCLMPPDFEPDIESSFADLILYSTGYSKYVDIGWGGFGFYGDNVVYSDFELEYDVLDYEGFLEATRVALEANAKIDYKNTNWLGGEKSAFDSFEQYKKHILAEKLKVQEHKKNINAIYESNLPKDIQLDKKYQNWRFSILIENKQAVLDGIFKSGLFASSHYQSVDFLFGKKIEKNTEAFKFGSKVVNLFNDFRFTEEKAIMACDVINKVLE